MIKKEPVSIRRQTIYAVLPFLDLYAAYRVQRLRWYLLITIGFGVLSSIVQFVLTPEIYTNPQSHGSEPVYIISYVLGIVASIVLSIYLIRRWSHRWNEKLKSV